MGGVIVGASIAVPAITVAAGIGKIDGASQTTLPVNSTLEIYGTETPEALGYDGSWSFVKSLGGNTKSWVWAGGTVTLTWNGSEWHGSFNLGGFPIATNAWAYYDYSVTSTNLNMKTAHFTVNSSGPWTSAAGTASLTYKVNSGVLILRVLVFAAYDVQSSGSLGLSVLDPSNPPTTAEADCVNVWKRAS